jgi:hypothetical protein
VILDIHQDRSAIYSVDESKNVEACRSVANLTNHSDVVLRDARIMFHEPHDRIASFDDFATVAPKTSVDAAWLNRATWASAEFRIEDERWHIDINRNLIRLGR